MKFQKMYCTRCQSIMLLSDEKPILTCPYCGAMFVTKQAIKDYGEFVSKTVDEELAKNVCEELFSETKSQVVVSKRQMSFDFSETEKAELNKKSFEESEIVAKTEFLSQNTSDKQEEMQSVGNEKAGEAFLYQGSEVTIVEDNPLIKDSNLQTEQADQNTDNQKLEVNDNIESIEFANEPENVENQLQNDSRAEILQQGNDDSAVDCVLNAEGEKDTEIKEENAEYIEVEQIAGNIENQTLVNHAESEADLKQVENTENINDEQAGQTEVEEFIETVDEKESTIAINQPQVGADSNQQPQTVAKEEFVDPFDENDFSSKIRALYARVHPEGFPEPMKKQEQQPQPKPFEYIRPKRVEERPKTEFRITDGVLNVYKGEDRIVTLPNEVKKINVGAFFGCNKMETINIGPNVEYIESGAFVLCVNISSINIDRNNKKYSSSGNCIVDKGRKTLILGCKNTVIPNDGSVVRIESGAFSNCAKTLEKIVIPYYVTSIGQAAFGKTSLKNVKVRRELAQRCFACGAPLYPDGVCTCGCKHEFYN